MHIGSNEQRVRLIDHEGLGSVTKLAFNIHYGCQNDHLLTRNTKFKV